MFLVGLYTNSHFQFNSRRPSLSLGPILPGIEKEKFRQIQFTSVFRGCVGSDQV